MAADATVNTISVPFGLVAVDAADGSERADQDAPFVAALFERHQSLLAASADPKWREVNLIAEADWPRLAPTRDWIEKHPAAADPALVEFRATGEIGRRRFRGRQLRRSRISCTEIFCVRGARSHEGGGAVSILVKAALGLVAGVVAGGLGLAFVPRVAPNALQPRHAVEKPQFVAAAASREAPRVAAVASRRGGARAGQTCRHRNACRRARQACRRGASPIKNGRTRAAEAGAIAIGCAKRHLGSRRFAGADPSAPAAHAFAPRQ